MKGTLFSADFVKDSTNNLRLLELNTDTVILDQELNNIDYTSFFNLLEDNNITTLDIIYKPYLHIDMVNHLTSLIATEAPFITTINLHDEEINSIYPVSIPDESNKFILRMCYDESAIFDSVYAKNRLNVYNLYTDQSFNDYTVAHYHYSLNGIKNTLVHELNPNNVPDVAIKDVDESFNPIDFFKIGSEISGETIQDRWESFVLENRSEDKLIEQYHFHTSSIDGNNHLTSVRYFGIVCGTNLDVIDLHSYKISSIFELPTTLSNDYDPNLYTNKLPDHHYYEFTTNFIKNDSGGILSTHIIQRGDSTWAPISDFIVGDTVASYFISGSPQTENNLGLLTWESEGSNLPSGSFLTSSEVIYKEIKNLKYNGMIELKVDGDSVFSGINKQYLIYDTGSNKTSFKYITNINPETDFFYDINANLIDIDEANFYVTTDNNLEFIEIDVEETDTYIISGATSFNTVVSHNSPCFVEGTKILLENGEEKNIEDVVIGDVIMSCDMETHSPKTSKVLNIISKSVDQIVEYRFSMGGTLRSTLDHPIYVIGKGWSSYSNDLSNALYKLEKPVNKIEIGDVVQLIDGNQSIESITLIEEKHKVYNLCEIEKYHNYFANNVLVHNRACFIAGTMVSLPNGEEKYIEDVEIGDIVLSYNESEKVIEEKTVVNKFNPIHDDLVQYIFSNGTKIMSTFDHPYYVNGLNLASYKPEWTNNRYDLPLNVVKINVGDKFTSLDGELVELISINELDKIDTQTYIISVEGNRNFFANKILVHNK
jgi:intein/homing endonuclease